MGVTPLSGGNRRTAHDAAASVVLEIGRSPEDVLQRAAAEALFLSEAHSAGISLLEASHSIREIRRRAVVGPWARYVNTTVDCDFGLESAAIANGLPRLFVSPCEHDPNLHALVPEATEMLVVPVVQRHGLTGAIWVTHHDSSRRFSPEDASRLLSFTAVVAAAFMVAVSLIARTPHVAQTCLPPSERPLSDRERQVCVLVAHGYSNSQIAEALSVGVKSVNTYRARVADKLGFRSRADFISYAAAHGWFERWPALPRG